MSRRVLIADDEPLALERMRQLLSAFDELAIVGECASGEAAIDAVLGLMPDILFLDVQMPRLDGFDVLAALGEHIDLPHMPLIVFVTAFDEHATRAFEVAAMDYIRKPVSRTRLDQAVSRAIEQLRLRDAARAAEGASDQPIAELESPGARAYATRFVVKRGSDTQLVRAADIDWIDAAGNYVRLHAGGRVYMLRATMADVESHLDPRHFARVHRSAMVNLDRVVKMEPFARGEYVIVSADGTRLRTSRAHSRSLRALLRRGFG